MMMGYLYFMGWLSFSLNRKHLLLMLLSLEFIVLILFYGLMLYFSLNMLEGYFNLIYLTFTVCEGALGLSLLVLMIRSHGNDYFNNLNVLW